MPAPVRALLRLVAATALAALGLAVTFVVAPVQGAPDHAPTEVARTSTP